MSSKTIRDFAKRGDAQPVPRLTRVQADAYRRFLQLDKRFDERDSSLGLEALMREVFPIASYDNSMKLEYLYYKLDEPRYTADECRELRLTFGRPFRVGVRLVREGTSEISEEEIYLGDVPIMMGGGEFIVNGAERCIVSQLHRSPGVDFSIVSSFGDRPLHQARIIPERGSWIELEVTKKDVLAMRIDQSTKLAATTFLRALDEQYSSTDRLLELFYEVEEIKVAKLKPEHYAAELVIDSDTGEELCRVGAPIGDMVATIQASNLGTIRVITDASDPLILNTLAEEKLDFLAGVSEHEAALLKIYGRLRPGNPPQIDKAKALFQEKFFDENRYRLGRVGRFRINRKFEHDPAYCVDGKQGKVPEEKVQHIRAQDFLAVIRYMLDLRAKRNKAHVDDIDHLGNRRLRTLDELATEEMRKGFLKLRRTVQERMSTREPGEVAKISDLVNSKSISSAIDFFFGRSELSQVVDQTNPLSMLVHERRLSALGPGGLNRKRAGFEVRDVHISHYGRICPIETPEGTNIGLIASLGIYSAIDDYGFLLTPYRKVKGGKVTTEIESLRADEELKRVLATSDVLKGGNKQLEGTVLARIDGDLAEVPAGEVEYVDVSPKQIVGVSASLIPFLEHDDANRALMGSNMQRQGVPLLTSDSPLVGTGIEGRVARDSRAVICSESAGKVASVTANQIVITKDGALPEGKKKIKHDPENGVFVYELRKFMRSNASTCINQKPIVKKGQSIKKGDVIADGPNTEKGELALGRNVLVAFMSWNGYNFEDAILISKRVVKEDIYTSIHIDEFEIGARD
ncbi:MAG: DNA-directed RNA polymerase subunit beta, partial [Phycisphaerales bacterium]